MVSLYKYWNRGHFAGVASRLRTGEDVDSKMVEILKAIKRKEGRKLTLVELTQYQEIYARGLHEYVPKSEEEIRKALEKYF